MVAVDLIRILISTFLVVASGSFELAHSQQVQEETAPDLFVEPTPPRNRSISVESGFASFYHAAFHGRRTASGETFNRYALTAAHKTLPFGTLVRVINLRNSRSVIVRVNDRGPLSKNRVIDVSPRAARELGFLAYGVTWVKLELLASDDLSDLEER